MLTYCYAGMGHTNMPTRCHAEMQKSGHAVVLTCCQAPKPVPEVVLFVAVLYTHICSMFAHVLH